MNLEAKVTRSIASVYRGLVALSVFALGSFAPAREAGHFEALDARAAALVLVPQVRKELGLSQAQIDRVRKIGHPLDEGRPNDDPNWFAMVRQLFDMLSQRQQARVRELELQHEGFDVLGQDVGLAKQVGISPAQMKAIKELANLAGGYLLGAGAHNMTLLSQKQRDAWGDACARSVDPDPVISAKARYEKVRIISTAVPGGDTILQRNAAKRQEIARQELQILTPGQRQKWNRLLGKPFRFPPETDQYIRY